MITHILALEKAPLGVVFEVAGKDDGEYLPKALANIENYKQQLKQTFPDIQIAVVTHGLEQFELMSEKTTKYPQAHGLAESLVKSDTPVYICGAHAASRGVETSEFPEYISIADRAPLQIERYQAQGYLLVIIE